MAKFKKTIVWREPSGQLFLCRVLNVGRSTDELKIIPTDPDSHMGGMYTEGSGIFTGPEFVRHQLELSYHHDGSRLVKGVGYSSQAGDVRKNPYGEGVRKLPLADIRGWEPFARYTVMRRIPYGEPADDKVALVPDGTVPAGTFQCEFSLGPTTRPVPEDAHGVRHFRIVGVGAGLDLLIAFQRSSYAGEERRLANGLPILLKGNVLECLERRTVWRRAKG